MELFQSQVTNGTDFEAILATEGMPPVVTPQEEVLAGDALEVSDHSAAVERAAQIAIEESGDKLWAA